MGHVYQGVQGMTAISREFNIPATTLYTRISRGMTIEQAVEAGKKAAYPQDRNETGKRKTAQKKQGITVVGIRYPDLMNSLWKLALGIGA